MPIKADGKHCLPTYGKLHLHQLNQLINEHKGKFGIYHQEMMSHEVNLCRRNVGVEILMHQMPKGQTFLFSHI